MCLTADTRLEQNNRLNRRPVVKMFVAFSFVLVKTKLPFLFHHVYGFCCKDQEASNCGL
jgi:hypothetical protein